MVQYVPLPVVGGYLGYVGYFCLAAGVSQACNVQVQAPARLITQLLSPLFAHPVMGSSQNSANAWPSHGEPSCEADNSARGCKGLSSWVSPPQIDSFASWTNLGSADALTKLGPALGSTLALLATLKLGRNPLLLPAVLLAIPAAFHLLLWAAGISRQQAADDGWTMQPEVLPVLLHWLWPFIRSFPANRCIKNRHRGLALYCIPVPTKRCLFWPLQAGQNFWEIYRLFNIHDLKFDGVYFPGILHQVRASSLHASRRTLLSDRQRPRLPSTVTVSIKAGAALLHGVQAPGPCMYRRGVCSGGMCEHWLRCRKCLRSSSWWRSGPRWMWRPSRRTRPTPWTTTANCAPSVWSLFLA